jgi:hypothetical protein
MAEHPSVCSRGENVVFVHFGHVLEARTRSRGAGRTCSSCAHWCSEDGAGSAGRCLADCGARPTTPESRCGEWRRPPLLTVV